jgi:hypothetical protein
MREAEGIQSSKLGGRDNSEDVVEVVRHLPSGEGARIVSDTRTIKRKRLGGFHHPPDQTRD